MLEKQKLQLIDFYFLGVLVVGAGFLVRALIALRVGRYPRSDGYGATLIGLILCALGGTILFVRLVACPGWVRPSNRLAPSVRPPQGVRPLDRA